MPLLWKSTKVSRISRLMADFQSPSKRGGSLVVETGFPTSLVDLFVKNRVRLKKQSKKKSQLEAQMEISSPMNVTPPPPCYSNRKVNSPSGCEQNVRRNKIKKTPVEELVVLEECVDDDRGVGDGDGEKKRRFIKAVLGVLLVMVLALCTKKLAIGFTKSAFLLLLLEFVGIRSKAITVFDCFVRRANVLCFYECKKDEEEMKSCGKDSTGGFSGGSVCDSKCVAVTPVEQIKSERKYVEVESGDRRENILDLEKKKRILDENEDKIDVSVGKKEQSRRAKMTANFKKLVPKKLCKKKDKKCKEKEVNLSTEVCSCAVGDILVQQKIDDKEEQDGEEQLSRSPLVEEVDSCKVEEVFDESLAEAKLIVVEESVEAERKRNSGYLILCLIVLAGLVGGRILALVLTVAWCLVLKLSGKLRPVKISSKK